MALATLEDSEVVVRNLDVLNDALGKVNGFLMRFMPLGVFAMTAAAAGTMTLEELDRLQGYLVIYVLAAVLLVWVVLPLFLPASMEVRTSYETPFDEDPVHLGMDDYGSVGWALLPSGAV